ncbi:MAG: hypothetical protein IPG54_04175 [Sphingomonadales bacterium]|jgi:hypothetical protein|nr:hypothetical protein [Sphingomonadales bacterium]MBK9003034.1 hypothetical protein [Sphingomonadales bacterium]MBK9268282.1 hypothetical protein [Sphingomonadales bacterium]
MFVIAFLLLTSAGQSAPDGLSIGSIEDSDAKVKLWDACLNKAIKNPAELTNDPSDLVVEIALINCEAEFSNARFAWRRMLGFVDKGDPEFD